MDNRFPIDLGYDIHDCEYQEICPSFVTHGEGICLGCNDDRYMFIFNKFDKSEEIL